MNFLANENIPLKSIKGLRESGYDIASITEECPGISDEKVQIKYCSLSKCRH